MWRRTYLLLLLVRIYLAVSPSYIHPDENFQGPEVIAGQIFGYPHLKTWEFTSPRPVRSLFPLWPAYGLPMLLLQWLWTETGNGAVAPQIIYYTLRILMFILSFVLEDWAIHELVQSPRERRVAVVLVASSYVTWTYQTHTFSNSLETLAVLWSIVMVQRILDNKHRSSLLSCALLGSLIAFGIFNRITFPAFLLPAAFVFTASVAIAVDTYFYHDSTSTLFQLLRLDPTVTPLNSLRYNTSVSNLSLHGIHPPHQHLIASLPLLLGPALFLLWNTRSLNLRILSAISALVLLSLIPHQEARFLMPIVPLTLSSVRLPKSMRLKRYWFGIWIVFNTILGGFMGIYHQGGVVSAQLWLGRQQEQALGVSNVFWWRTYSPPVWLLGEKDLITTDLMGMQTEKMKENVLGALVQCGQQRKNGVGLVAPWSSMELDTWIQNQRAELSFEKMWMTRNHLNLDDLDIEKDGFSATMKRVIGRRGLVVWKIRRRCDGG
ncbi:MAG: hypothetical protein Q9220_004513 [cf. Caloplaca sp. 1 TL-2023]